MTAQLTIGPILSPLACREKRDFYFRIADEAPVETGLSGRSDLLQAHALEQHYSEVAERLMAGGKGVLLSG